ATQANPSNGPINEQQTKLCLIPRAFDDENRADNLSFFPGKPSARAPFVRIKNELNRDLRAIRLVNVIEAVVRKILYAVDINQLPEIPRAEFLVDRNSRLLNFFGQKAFRFHLK